MRIPNLPWWVWAAAAAAVALYLLGRRQGSRSDQVAQIATATAGTFTGYGPALAPPMLPSGLGARTSV